ncbi:MAG TPA: hypothetical protein VN329_08865 [Roseomonas sp.]|nr:hypothetical protein [Roseomonas sp.]
MSRLPRRGCLAAALLGLLLATPAAAQQPPCAASSDTPRTAAEVQAAVLAHRCAPGTQLRVAMTVAGQAIVLQQTGLCDRDTFRTASRQVADGSRVLGVTCIIAAR